MSWYWFMVFSSLRVISPPPMTRLFSQKN